MNEFGDSRVLSGEIRWEDGSSRIRTETKTVLGIMAARPSDFLAEVLAFAAPPC